MRFAKINRFPGYCFGEDGSVWSLRAGTEWSQRKLHANRGGYQEVTLRTGDGHQATCLVHRLVLEAFVGPPPDGCVGCHENGIRSDNRVGNLRWDTPTSNIHDKRRHGTHREGEGHHNAALTNEQATAIRKRYAERDITYHQLATAHGVSITTIHYAIKGKTYREHSSNN